MNETLMVFEGTKREGINLRSGRSLASFLFTLAGSLYFSFRVSAEMGLPSETKIEPDRRLRRYGGVLHALEHN